MYQASTWRRIGDGAGKVSTDIGKLDPAGNPGPFADFIKQYTALAHDISTWTGQGKAEMDKIAVALEQSIAVYDEAEHKIVSHIQSIGHH